MERLLTLINSSEVQFFLLFLFKLYWFRSLGRSLQIKPSVVSYVVSQKYCYPFSNPGGDGTSLDVNHQTDGPIIEQSGRSINQASSCVMWSTNGLPSRTETQPMLIKKRSCTVSPNSNIQLLIIVLPSTTSPSFKKKCDQLYSLCFEMAVY